MIEYRDPQGSDAWHAARRGVITASRAKDARSRSDGLEKRQRVYVDAMLSGKGEAEALRLSGYKKPPTSDLVKRALAGETLPLVWSDAAIAYAQDTARDRVGAGRPVNKFEGFAQRTGHEEEPFAAIAWIAETGKDVEEVGFITSDDGIFGVSLDRRVVGESRAIEIKAMVSSATLFKAVVDGDISEYRDQCLFAMWLLGLESVDLCLWAPDLPKPLHVVTIQRDEQEIQALEDDMLAFRALVDEYEAKLRAKLGLSAMSAIGGAPATTADDPKPAALPPRPSLPPRAAAPVTAARPAPTAPRLEDLTF